MIIKGKNSVFEALQGNTTINKLYVLNNLNDTMSNKIIKLAKEKGVRIDFTDKSKLEKLSGGEKTQGFVAEVVEFDYCSLDEILEVSKIKGTDPFILILDGIEDPHNFGAIIRSAECAGVDGIIIGKHRCCAVTDTVVRVSAGAINNMKIAKVTNLNQTIELLKENNIWVYALELGGEELTKSNLKGSIALVVGSEGKGVSEQVKKNSDAVVSLKMYGNVNSLNASVATGVALFEIVRQRNI